MVPAFNAERTLAETLRSAISIGFTEIIVVDDGSSDNTSLVASEFPVKIVKQKNSGAYAARMYGLENVRTKYVIFLDSDDTLLASVFEIIEFFNENPQYVGITGGYVAAGARRSRSILPKGTAIEQGQLLAKGSGLFPLSASIWKSEIIYKTMALPITPLHERFADDYELVIRATYFGSVGMFPKVITKYSIDGGKSTKNLEGASKSSSYISRYYRNSLTVSGADHNARSDKYNIHFRKLQLSFYNESFLDCLKICFVSPLFTARIVLSKVRTKLYG